MDLNECQHKEEMLKTLRITHEKPKLYIFYYNCIYIKLDYTRPDFNLSRHDICQKS